MVGGDQVQRVPKKHERRAPQCVHNHGRAALEGRVTHVKSVRASAPVVNLSLNTGERVFAHSRQLLQIVSKLLTAA